MINDGLNGFVVLGRDSENYAKAVYNAMNLESAAQNSLKVSERYSVKHLAHDLGAIWPPLKGA
jgi:hypothetical protein